ncbi:iron(III) transport system substrate-binding protein [Geomicrobium halophilum]|uniref:Iron(III) transport system substrate-binding protein n=1 Tax=Geomicrobium halophilum TaxID=549000 RepID=A0A841PTK2_9BACL|nr:extracellular solute-binding protein [Geomicrobium halophilum]MBB6451104.1 iron(III) transport system substrate-binding protein [Geomicrobium halophilum]
MKRYSWLSAAFLSVAVIGAGCGQEDGEEAGSEGSAQVEGEEDGELVVYSARNETFVNQFLDKFEEETGIEVQALHADDTAVNRIQEEANNVQADVFISNDVGALEHLRLQGLLDGYEADNIESIDEDFRAEDDSWVALSARTRVLMYNEDLVNEEDVPDSIAELADPEYAGQFAVTRGANGSMIGHVSALRQEWGDDQTVEWLSEVGDNAGIITDGHGDIREAVGTGEVEFGLVNNYYYHQQLEEPQNNNVGVVYPDQGDDEMGAVLNAAGIGLINDGPNRENAETFMDWALEEENQQEFSYESLEVPINPDIEPVDDAASIDEYKTHDMPLRELGEVWDDTLEVIEESGMDLEVR